MARFGHPKAEVRIEARKEPPLGKSASGGVNLTITMWPLESFLLRRAWLELALRTTRFSRTTLDGYREHTLEEVWQTFELCENATAQPGVPFTYPVELRLPENPSFEPRPARMLWMAKARFQAEGHREFSASKGLGDVKQPHGGPPVVDGTGFLPLYEFRADS